MSERDDRMSQLSPAQLDQLMARLRRRKGGEEAPKKGPAPGTALATGTGGPAPVARGVAYREDGIRPLAPEAGPPPLSFAQERLWFLDQLAPGNPAYNIPGGLELTGPLDVARLRASLSSIRARHEALRTVFPAREGRGAEVGEGGAVPRVLPPAPLPLPVADLAGLSPESRRRELRRLAEEESRRSFDLARGPLMRTILLRLKAGEEREQASVHLLLVSFHHIAADGWSVGILFRELAAFYRAGGGSGEGAGADLPPLPIQYGDFAAWQRRHLAGEELARLLAFWKEETAELPALALPLDHPRPAVQSSSGAKRPFFFPPPAEEALRGLTRLPLGLPSGTPAGGAPTGGAVRGNATLFMVLLAVFQAWAHRVTGQGDFAVGTPTAGRNRPETAGLIGCFINTLVLRGRPGEASSFRELLAAVRARALAAYAHQELPFAKLVEELDVPRHLSRNPLVQVLVSLQNAPMSMELPGTGLELDVMEVDNGTAKLDLTLTFIERPTGLWCGMEYDTDLFDGATVVRMAEQLRVLAAAAAADPERPLRELPLLGPAQAHQLRSELQGAALPEPSPETPESGPAAGLLHAAFFEQARRVPERIALVGRPSAHRSANPGEGLDIEQVSYGELARRAAALAGRLAARGVGTEGVVGLHLHRGTDLAAALFGVLAAGGAYLPLDPAYPRARLAGMLRDSGARWLLTDTGTGHDGLGGDGEWEVIEIGEALSAGGPEGEAPGDASPARAQAEQLAYLIYTSGSTGKPKGVMVPHAGAAAFCRAMEATLPPSLPGPARRRPGRWLAATSVSFDISVLELFWTLGRGDTVLLAPSGSEPSSSALAAPSPKAGGGGKLPSLSLFYFASDADSGADDRYRLLVEGARRADRAGFEAVWTPERHFHAFGGLYPNPAVTSSALSLVTERVALRAGSVVLPLHDPLRVAEEWAVVDNLSRGRVGISFASGWHPVDFSLAPGSYRDRKRILLEGIETVRRLWRGETVTRTTGGGHEVELEVHPRPIQRELPVWLTAAGNPETFRLAGEIGAGLLTHLLTQSPAEAAEKIALYRRAWREAGHEGEGHVTLMVHTFVGDDLAAVRATVREPFTRYLATSGDLLDRLRQDLLPEDEEGGEAGLTEEESAALLEHAVERYMAAAAFFTTVEEGPARMAGFRDLGVDELACLVDFGVPTEKALEGIDALAELGRAAKDRAAGEQAGSAWGEAVPVPSPASAGTSPLLAALEQPWAASVDRLQVTPSAARLLLADDRGRRLLAGLDLLALGGEAFPADLAAELRQLPRDLPRTGPGNFALWNLYGPTETSVWSTAHPLGRAAANGGAAPGAPPIGRPIPGTRVHVVDRGLHAQPLGVPGHLVIGGAGVTRGYHRRAALTAERFVPDPFGASSRVGAAGSPGGGRLYATGDRARLRPDGRLEYLGRTDSQIKLRGHRIELGEIEATLAAHPLVREAAVVLRRRKAEGEGAGVGGDGAEAGEGRLVAYAVPRHLPPVEVDEAERERLLAGRSTIRLPNGLLLAQHDGRQTRAGYRELFEEPEYLKHGLRFPDGGTYFDVGANIGLFTLFVSSICEPGRIFAFEPMPPNFELLRINAALYGRDVELTNAGVGAEAGTVPFTFYPHASGLSGRFADQEEERHAVRMMVGEHSQGDDGEDDEGGEGASGSGVLGSEEMEAALDRYLETEVFDCPLVALSDVIDEHGVSRIDLLKVDAEKSEVEVLKGIRDEHWPMIQQVVAEVHSKELLAETEAILGQHGFEIVVDDFVVMEGASPDEEGMYVYMLYAHRPDREEVMPTSTRRAAVPFEALSAERLDAYLRKRLPEVMVPSAYLVLDRLPRTANAKLDRRALPEPEAAARASRPPYVPPGSALERRVAEVWGEVLGVERVGLDDNFFEIGGNSLTLVTAHRRLAGALDREVSLVNLFQHPTVRALAHFLRTGEGERNRAQEARERGARAREAAQARARPEQGRPGAGRDASAIERQRRFMEERRRGGGGRGGSQS